MNIFKIMKLSIEKTVENASFLLVNDLMLTYATMISIGVFLAFFLIGLSFSYYFLGPTNQIYLLVNILIFLIGVFAATLILFPSIGTYIYFVYETLSLKRKYNMMEGLEYFEKNFVSYVLGGLLQYGPIILLWFLFFLIGIVFKNVFILVFFFLCFLITTFLYCCFTFLTYPAILINKMNAISAFIQSINLTKKYFIQTVISVLILNSVKIVGLLLLFAYPIFFYYIYMPIYSYFLTYYYKAITNQIKSPV